MGVSAGVAVGLGAVSLSMACSRVWICVLKVSTSCCSTASQGSSSGNGGVDLDGLLDGEADVIEFLNNGKWASKKGF